MGSYKNIQVFCIFAALLGIITLSIGIWIQSSPAEYDLKSVCPDVASNEFCYLSAGPSAPVGIAVGVLMTLLGIAAIVLDMEKFLGVFGLLFFVIFILSLTSFILSVRDLAPLPKNATDEVNCSNYNTTTTKYEPINITTFATTVSVNNTSTPANTTYAYNLTETTISVNTTDKGKIVETTTQASTAHVNNYTESSLTNTAPVLNYTQTPTPVNATQYTETSSLTNTAPVLNYTQPATPVNATQYIETSSLTNTVPVLNYTQTATSVNATQYTETSSLTNTAPVLNYTQPATPVNTTQSAEITTYASTTLQNNNTEINLYNVSGITKDSSTHFPMSPGHILEPKDAEHDRHLDGKGIVKREANTEAPLVDEDSGAQNLTTFEDASIKTKHRLIGYACLGVIDVLSQLGSLVLCYLAFR